MQKIAQIFTISLFLFIGNQSSAQDAPEKDQMRKQGSVFVGEKFSLENALSAYEMEVQYRGLKPGDTLSGSFQAEVTSVCKKKGCWMKVALTDGAEVMVKFKDYAFFVPRDIESRSAFLNGRAYVEEMSVEEQRHYAEDEGLSQEEIAAINKPKKTLLFMADGVHIQK